MKRPTGLLVGTAVGALSVLGFAGVAIGAAVGTQNDADKAARQPASVTEMIGERTDAERARDLAHAPPDVRDGVAQLERDLQSGWVPVSDGTRTRGVVSTKMLDAPPPTVEADLFPVYDTSGQIVGYYAADVGFVPAEVVDAPGALDLCALPKMSFSYSGPEPLDADELVALAAKAARACGVSNESVPERK